ncbi:type IV secretion system protein VirB10 [Sphingomonas carotinifaciens]|uniref:Type IV secretion system protein VirB10 n=1 Tax=Sphingomonas carotinifaciens TaxID=1166323 RepID=A0A1G7Q2J6_9SPHN|nr:type IV secretion system protein VirB10 [Sphingomonas carotinifaciens]MBB4087607.1 type IV secretion system protein VirB10 [Sphingomonas carotinifaciens]MWC45692.1 type VI secretion protein [Sphingomonas carotinifaciens]SDF92734.1 type IV secretion system protein VirB10 [Sphingomonas carotinifaciens]
MAEAIIDRGGTVGPDPVAAQQPETAVTRNGGWGNIALVGAGIGLIGAIGGIAIGYGAFHQPTSSTTAVPPAKASERSVDEVMANPNAQRAALANQLGQPGAPATDIFGRPIVPAAPAVDASGNVVAAGGAAAGPATIANGQQTPAQRRAEQARLMADASRRSPIMAFGSMGSGAPAYAGANAGGAAARRDQDDLQGRSDRTEGQSMVAGRNLGGSGFEEPSGAATPTGKGSTDFSEQLSHSTIQTVRATMVTDRSLLLSAGTVIPCTLQTAINSTQAGFVSCVINHDVFSENGRIVLLDKGTKVLGQYSGGITQGQARLFVLWTRALTPRGVAIDLGSPAADSLGRAGLPGGVDTQFWSRFGLGLVISVLEDASNIASRAVQGEGTYSTQVPGNTANTVLQQTMQVRPILKKNQGDTAAIFVAKDFDFRSVYEVRLRR